MNARTLEQLRRAIENTLADLGIPDAPWSCVKVSDHHEASPNEVLAVWLADQDKIEFYDQDGTLLKTVVFGETKPEQGKAA